jgi:hypothetical protein
LSSLHVELFRLLPSTTRFIKITTHTQELLYFTNYHISDYVGFRLYNKTLDESKQHTGRVFIGQRVMHIDREHQLNKPNKGLSEKTESNKRTHA